MALGAIVSELSPVNIVFLMAVLAGRRGLLQIGHGNCAGMAGSARLGSMLAGERECGKVMREGFAIAIQTVMTGDAIGAKISQVLVKKHGVTLVMTILAGSLVEGELE